MGVTAAVGVFLGLAALGVFAHEAGHAVLGGWPQNPCRIGMSPRPYAACRGEPRVPWKQHHDLLNVPTAAWIVMAGIAALVVARR